MLLISRCQDPTTSLLLERVNKDDLSGRMSTMEAAQKKIIGEGKPTKSCLIEVVEQGWPDVLVGKAI